MQAIINGTIIAAPDNAVAYKYADPTEDARWVFDEGEAREIEGEDPNIIVWVEDTHDDQSTRRRKAMTERDAEQIIDRIESAEGDDRIQAFQDAGEEGWSILERGSEPWRETVRDLADQAGATFHEAEEALERSQEGTVDSLGVHDLYIARKILGVGNYDA